MTRTKVLNYRIFKRSVMSSCLQSAYEDYLNMVKTIFINIGEFKEQLTYSQLVHLFEIYDWSDFFNTLEELENSSLLDSTKPLYDQVVITIELFAEKGIRNKWRNSYFQEYVRDPSPSVEVWP